MFKKFDSSNQMFLKTIENGMKSIIVVIFILYSINLFSNYCSKVTLLHSLFECVCCIYSSTAVAAVFKITSKENGVNA